MLSLCLVLALAAFDPNSQSATGNVGTVTGAVMDPTGAVIPGASVSMSYRVSGFQASGTTDANGVFRFERVPFNPYHLSVTAPGFQAVARDVDVRSSVPVTVNVTLPLAAERTTVTVHSESGDLLESVPTAHTDIDRELLRKLPVTTDRQ